MKTINSVSVAFQMLVFLCVVQPQCVFADSPVEAANRLVSAAKNIDTTAWYKNLSRTDKERIKARVGEHKKKEFETEKERYEKEFNTRINDVYEFVGAEIILQVNDADDENKKLDPFSLFFIKNERIWDNKYAEVIIFLPIIVKGVTPPLILSFVKEGKQWKLAETVSASPKNDFDEFLRFYFDLMMGVEFDRADMSKVKKREFRLDKALSEKYLSAWKAANAYNKNELLFSWVLTGDKAAEEIWERERKSGNNVIDEQELNAYRKYFVDGSMSGNAALNPKTDKKPVPEMWFRKVQSAFFRDILAYRNFMKKFSREKIWCAKAQYQIAENYEYIKEYELAEKEYLSFLENYPGAEDTGKAKTNLARLGQKKFGR